MTRVGVEQVGPRLAELLALVAAGEDVLITDQDRTVGRITAAREGREATAAPAVGTEEWTRMNVRRGELIRRKHQGGLPPEEAEELEALQELARAALAAAHPPPEWLGRVERLRGRLEGVAPGGTE